MVVGHQRENVVEMRPHAAGVKVDDSRSVCIFRVRIIVHKYDNHNVIANVTFPLQLLYKISLVQIIINLVGLVNLFVEPPP